jgi:hypothetical protein
MQRADIIAAQQVFIAPRPWSQTRRESASQVIGHTATSPRGSAERHPRKARSDRSNTLTSRRDMRLVRAAVNRYPTSTRNQGQNLARRVVVVLSVSRRGSGGFYPNAEIGNPRDAIAGRFCAGWECSLVISPLGYGFDSGNQEGSTRMAAMASVAFGLHLPRWVRRFKRMLG